MKLFPTCQELAILLSITRHFSQRRMHDALTANGICAFDFFTAEEIAWLKTIVIKQQHYELGAKIQEFERANFPATDNPAHSLSPLDQPLTHELLPRLGFRGEGKDIVGNPAYRLEVPPEKGFYYSYQVQLVINPSLPASNYNSGIVSLYRPAEKDAHVIASDSNKEMLDFVLRESTTSDKYIGIKYQDMPAQCIPIAGHVTHLSRLNAIYTALTQNRPLEVRLPPAEEKQVLRSSCNTYGNKTGLISPK